MQVEIITIGDEILIGQIVDTNSAWMGVELNKAGFDVVQISSVRDREAEIIRALELALSRADVVLMTGGIGPTRDDVTKITLCRFFDAELVFDEEVYQNIERLLKHRQSAINELTRSQALVPDKARIFSNTVGTAPITWFEQDGKVVVSMPGVPYEMKTVMSEAILPALKEHFKTPTILHQTLLVKGFPESALAIKIQDWEQSLPESVRLAYLPNFNIVKLRLTASSADKDSMQAIINEKVAALKLILGNALFYKEDLPLEAIIGRKLASVGASLSLAESCTGGHIAHRITAVPGSSAYFKGGVVAYDNELKINLLNVSAKDLQQEGAVSQVVVEQMARGVRELLNTDYALATSGIAGPDGGTEEKPVGTVWIALATRELIVSQRFQFRMERSLNIERSTQAALLMLLDQLDNN